MALSLALINMLTDYPYCNGVRKPISHWSVSSGKAASRLESESGDGCSSMKVILWNKEDADIHFFTMQGVLKGGI